MSKVIISPSILGLEDKAKFINKALKMGITHIHYDIMDGHFVPAKSISEDELEYILNHTDKHIKDIHLMVLDPLHWIKKFESKVNFITFHYEAESIDRMKKIFKKYGYTKKIGIAIKPKTKVQEIVEFLHDASHVLVMSVEPGKGGQTFIEESIEKVKDLKTRLNKINSKAFIQIDGGINLDTAKKSIKAGVSNLVVGSFLQKNLNKKGIIASLKGK